MADVDVSISSGDFAANEVSLSANTVKTVGFDGDLSTIEVANFGGTATVYVAFVDGQYTKSAALPTDTGGAKHCVPVYPNSVASGISVRTNGPTLVSLKSSAATTVWVTAIA